MAARPLPAARNPQKVQRELEDLQLVMKARNGTLIRLAPGEPEIVTHVKSGRIFKDGNVLVDSNDRAIPERRKLAFTGIVSVAIALDRNGEVKGEPSIDLMGLPSYGRKGEVVIDVIGDAVERTLAGLSRVKRRDSEAVENAVDRAIRSAVNEVWGKKPACHVMVVEV